MNLTEGALYSAAGGLCGLLALLGLLQGLQRELAAAKSETDLALRSARAAHQRLDELERQIRSTDQGLRAREAQVRLLRQRMVFRLNQGAEKRDGQEAGITFDPGSL